MGSKKRSAKAKQIAQFKAGLGPSYADDIFSKERARQESQARAKEEARRAKACEKKNRYRSKTEADSAIADCAHHGTIGLSSYKCPYCNGWHLTSHPWDA